MLSFDILSDRLILNSLLPQISDVEAGGATVFPKVYLAVWPRKGSAAFLYYLHPISDAMPPVEF